MPEGLRFKVSADISEPVAAIKVLEKKSDDLGKALSLPNLSFQSFTKISGVLKQTEQPIKAITRANENAAKSFEKINPSANQATQSLTNVGRVAQDLPFGFIGIANNLNPLLESFQRLRATTGTTGGAFKALGQAMLGPAGIGVALSIVSSALISFGHLLGSNLKHFGDAELAAGRFADQLRRLGEDAEELKKKLDFRSDINKLKFELAGLTGFELDKAVFGEGAIKNAELKRDLDARINVLEQFSKVQNAAATKAAKAVDALPGKIKDAAQLIKEFGSASLIPQPLVDALSEGGGKAGIETIRATDKEIKKLKEQRQAVEQDDVKARLSIVNKFNKENERKLKEGIDANKKFIDETIDQAKRIASEFPSLLPVPIFESVLLSKAQSFDIAQKFINDFQEGLKTGFARTPTRVPIELVPVPPKQELDQSKLTNLFKGFTAPVDLKGVFDFDPLKELRLKELADQVNNLVIPAFDNFFNNIVQGQNVFKAFGQFVIQILTDVIKKVIQAAITSFILKTILGGAGAGVGALVGAFGGFRAAGGPVTAGKSYVVGENGPEIFRPQVSGNIQPNSSTRNMASGPGGGIVHVMVTGRLRGRDQVLQTARTLRGQRATA